MNRRDDDRATIATEPADEGGPVAVPSHGWAGIGDVAVILALAGAAWVLSGDFAGGNLMVAYGIAPAVVPRAVIIVIAALAVLLLVGELPRARGRPRPRVHPRVGHVAFALAALTLYALSFEPLGAFTLMPLFCVAVSRAFVRRPFWKLLAYGVLVSIMSYVLFVLLLRAPLPGSRLPFL